MFNLKSHQWKLPRDTGCSLYHSRDAFEHQVHQARDATHAFHCLRVDHVALRYGQQHVYEDQVLRISGSQQAVRYRAYTSSPTGWDGALLIEVYFCIDHHWLELE